MDNVWKESSFVDTYTYRLLYMQRSDDARVRRFKPLRNSSKHNKRLHHHKAHDREA